MYSAVWAIENHSPLIKFPNLIFGVCVGGNYLHVDTIPAWKPFLILGLMCSQNLYLCPLFLLSLQSEGLILPQFPISVTGPFSPEEGKEAGPCVLGGFPGRHQTKAVLLQLALQTHCLQKEQGPSCSGGFIWGRSFSRAARNIKNWATTEGFRV